MMKLDERAKPKGFLASLTEQQRREALAYRGEENIGVEFAALRRDTIKRYPKILEALRDDDLR